MQNASNHLCTIFLLHLVLLLHPTTPLTSTSTTTTTKPHKRTWTGPPTTLTSTWKTHYDKLLHYKSIHGHCRVPLSHPELGSWISQQRRWYKHPPKKKHGLSPERLEALQKIDFIWDARDDQWNHQLHSLERFFKTNNHWEASGTLGAWVRRQRQLYLEGTLRSNRLSKLRKVGFLLETPQSSRGGTTTPDKKWMQRFHELCEYFSQYGDCNVPLHYHPNPKLGVWVSNQRRQYKASLDYSKYQHHHQASSSSMTRERIEALEGIGFLWDLKNESWKRRFDELRDYKYLHGHCLVPQTYRENPALGIWVVNQRTQYRYFCDDTKRSSSSMTKEKIRALEELNFCWKKPDWTWRNMLQRYTEYRRRREKEGRTEVEKEEIPEEEGELRLWVMYQRNEYQKYRRGERSHLTEKRLKALEEVDFVWEGPATARQQGEASPTVEDWGKLFEKMRESGIDEKAKAKQHWFDGMERFEEVEEGDYDEEDLLNLWNEEDEDEDDW